MKSIRLIAAAAALSFSSFVNAQDAAMGGGMGMGMGMGMSIRLPAFADIDKSGDGKVSKEELGALVPARVVERMFGNLDSDDDGSLSEEEFTARRRAAQPE